MRTAIRVISLDDADERRSSFMQHAAEAGVEWSFFQACRGAVSPLRYDQRDAVRHFGRPMVRGEIGCYASHYKCWEWLVNSEFDQVVIFEDDVFIDWPVIRKLVELDAAKHNIDMIRLYFTHPIKWRIVKYRFISSKIHLIRTIGMSFGSQGYLITKPFAALMIQKYVDVRYPIDWVISRYWEHQGHIFCTFPFPVVDTAQESIIGARAWDTFAPTLADRAVRFYRRLRDRLARAIFDRFRVKSRPFGPTADSGPSFL